MHHMIDETRLCRCHNEPMYRSEESKRWGPRWHCRVRRREYAKQYYAAHREALIARATVLNKANPERRRKTHLKRQYGITPEVYEAMYAGQNGLCAICLEQHKRLVVDHDHDSGRVRGLLCRKCNAAIGQLKDDPALLRRALRWVEDN